ncbi:MAG: hypothetical protein ACPGVT_08025 [Maricaulaceae bacterium]
MRSFLGEDDFCDEESDYILSSFERLAYKSLYKMTTFVNLSVEQMDSRRKANNELFDGLTDELKSDIKLFIFTLISKKSQQPKNNHPRVAMKLAWFLLPRKERDFIIGDLEEEYLVTLEKLDNPFWAKAWYWKELCFTLWGCLYGSIQKAIIGVVRDMIG